MKTYTIEELNQDFLSLTYNDIGLVPNFSYIQSRSKVYTGVNIKSLKMDLGLPVINAPMNFVNANFCDFLSLNFNSCLALPRRGNKIKLKHYSGNEYISQTISLKNASLPHTDDYLPNVLCIDSANGGNESLKTFFKFYLDRHIKVAEDSIIIIGNYADVNSFLPILPYIGDKEVYVRVGIGSGAACTTSIKTGIGCGQASSVMDFYVGLKERGINNVKIIADSGIRVPGDVFKALALGADLVMIGSLFAGTKESNGEVLNINGKQYKKYYGSASSKAKNSEVHIEGEEVLVPYTGDANHLLINISEGIQSGLSYLGFESLDELKQNRDALKFVKLSHNSQREKLTI